MQMNKILLTVDGIQVSSDVDGRVSWWSGTTIDADGSGPSQGDRTFQADTSLHFLGRPLNSVAVPYIVVPPQLIDLVPGIVLGCQARVTFGKLFTMAVVGDVGPRKHLGEMSIACARAVGIPASPVSGGIELRVVQFEFWPGRAAQVKGVDYTLQPKGGSR